MTEIIQNLYIPIGLPCCGKSTFYKRMISHPDFCSTKIIGPDIIRERLFPGYEDGLIPFENIDQEVAFLIAEREMEDYLLDGYSVWFDAMNTHYKSRLILFHRGQAVEYTPLYPFILNYILIKMNVDFDIIKERNQKCRKGYRMPPIERLESMNEYFNCIQEEDLYLPAKLEIWNLQWQEQDNKWIVVEGGETCKRIVDIVNSTGA